MGPRSTQDRKRIARALVLLLVAVAIAVGWKLGAPATNATTAQSGSDSRTDAAPHRVSTDSGGTPARDTDSNAADETGATDAAPGQVELAEEYLARINRLGSAPYIVRPLFEIALEIAKLQPPEAALEILREVYRSCENPITRSTLLKAFNETTHPYVLAALTLGDADDDARVRAAARAARLRFAFRWFRSDDEALAVWNSRYGALPLAEAWPLAAKEFVNRLASSTPEQAAEFLADLYPGLFRVHREEMERFGVTKAIAEAGLVAVTERLLHEPAMAKQRGKLLALLITASPGNATARQVLLPMLDDPDSKDPRMVSIAAAELGTPDRPWAADALLRALRKTKAATLTAALAESFAKAKGKSAVPHLIAVLVEDDSGRTRRTIGEVLTGLTGVRYRNAHDVRWWSDWWQRNRDSFGGGALPTVR